EDSHRAAHSSRRVPYLRARAVLAAARQDQRDQNHGAGDGQGARTHRDDAERHHREEARGDDEFLTNPLGALDIYCGALNLGELLVRFTICWLAFVMLPCATSAQAPGKFPPDSLVNVRVIPKSTPVVQ